MRSSSLALLIALAGGCAQVPDGVLFKCDDGGCPVGARCTPLAMDLYCVSVDGGAGGAAGGGGPGGGRGGGAAGGGVAGGQAGGSSGGAVAGGMAGGTTGGGSSGGAAGGSSGGTAGGTSGGSSGGTAGGTSGGTSGGSSGGTAGGMSGGTAGGTSGGTAGGMSGGTAGGTSGGTAGGTSGGTAGGASGGMAGGTSGGSSGGSSGGVAGGSAGGASGGSAGPVYAQLARFQNSRFVGIAGVGLAGAPSAVGTLRTDGGSSLYESWASDGGIVDRVDAGLSTGLAIASNRTTRAIASRFGGAISATTYAPPLAVTNGVSLGVGEVRRLQVLEGAPDRVAALTQDLNMGVLQVLDPGYGTAPISGTALTLDELIEVTDNGPLRYLVTMRCLSCQVGTLVASNPTRAHYWAAFESNGAGGITPLWLSPTIPGGGTVTISSPVRVARDGFTYLYLAGQQPGGSLAIERRFAADGGVASTPTSMPLATSVAPLTFADMIRGPGGPNVLVLAKAPNPTTFAGQPVGGASTNNIVVLAGSANGYSATTLDVSGDQNPVAFAHGGDGWLYIILNEGPDTVLWRVPVPLPP